MPWRICFHSRNTAQLPGLDVRGLMAVMPDLRDEDALRPYFQARMRELFERLQTPLPERGLKNFRWAGPAITRSLRRRKAQRMSA